MTIDEVKAELPDAEISTTCEECGVEASMLSMKRGVTLCGPCAGDCCPCQQCGSHDVVFSDYGVDLCAPCKKAATPEQKQWLNEQAYNDAFDSGRI